MGIHPALIKFPKCGPSIQWAQDTAWGGLSVDSLLCVCFQVQEVSNLLGTSPGHYKQSDWLHSPDGLIMVSGELLALEEEWWS